MATGVSSEVSPDDYTRLATELQNFREYVYGKCEHTPLAGFGSLTYMHGAQALATQTTNEHFKAVGFWAAGRALKDKESEISINDRVYTQVELYIEAIRWDSTFSKAFNNLGAIVSGERAQLLDGRILNSKDLYYEAIRHDATDATPFTNLASELRAPNEHITIPDGRTFDKRGLLQEALRLEPGYSLAINALAYDLKPDERVALADGKNYSEKELYIEGIRLNPTTALLYSNLGSALNDGETATLAGSTDVWTAKKLYLEAIRLNPAYAMAYSNLAVDMSNTEQVHLPDGRHMSKIEMYVHALALDSRSVSTYNNLGVGLLSKTATVTLADGRVFTKQDLYMEAVRLKPAYDRAYKNLLLIIDSQLPWSPRMHFPVFSNDTGHPRSKKTNMLFGTLLLGLQRLEDVGLLALAHHAMLEEMLEFWVWKDTDGMNSFS